MQYDPDAHKGIKHAIKAMPANTASMKARARIKEIQNNVGVKWFYVDHSISGFMNGNGQYLVFSVDLGGRIYDADLVGYFETSEEAEQFVNNMHRDQKEKLIQEQKELYATILKNERD